jgi:hypothetical protein
MKDRNPDDPQQLLTLAATAAAQGDYEVAYLLYAKSNAKQTSHSQYVDDDKKSKSVAGQLQTLAAMCQPPTAAAAAISPGRLGPTRSSNAGLSSAYTTNSSGVTYTNSSTSFPQPLLKRWQHMQQRLQLCCTDNNTSSTISSQSLPSADGTRSSSANSTTSATSRARRVFCISDMHVDRAGGANMAWLQSISSSSFQDDVIIVAGEARGLQH